MQIKAQTVTIYNPSDLYRRALCNEYDLFYAKIKLPNFTAHSWLSYFDMYGNQLDCNVIHWK